MRLAYRRVRVQRLRCGQLLTAPDGGTDALPRHYGGRRVSYHCGIGPGMQAIGVAPREPHLVCDGCGATKLIVNPNSRIKLPPSWFLAGRAAPGWRMLRVHDGSKRWELCPKCWMIPDTTVAAGGEKS